MSDVALGWYVRRLRRMSPAEVTRRAVDESRRRLWRPQQVMPGRAPGRVGGVRASRAFGPAIGAGARTRVDARASRAVVAAADRVLAGRWSVFGVERGDSADPDWFLDPATGRRAPDQRFAFTINHRDESGTGNIKQIWEMSRHHHLTVLAAAWWLTRDDRYAQAVAGQLRSWWRANPFLSGVHWTSGIEAGIRLVSWVWVRRLLDDWPGVTALFENDPDALRQIGWHQKYLAAFPSYGSSANNHIIAEAAGRLAAACAFPWYPQSGRWRKDAAAVLERQLAANTFASGLNRELATDYHRFVLDLALVAAVEADAHGVPLSEQTWELIARMLDAGAAILDATGRPPRQGDGDEGRVLVVDDPDADPWAVTLSAGAAVLGAAPWWPPLGESIAGVLLSGLSRRRLRDPLERPSDRPTVFPDAGMVILRSRPEDGPEIWCRCDGGPHGFLSIAAHAHADALSIEVRHDGVDILVDPGTYCYHGEPAWRQWFRSTAAHNTLEVAGVDQSESGGPFLWISQARTETLGCRVDDPAEQTWSARHDGYLRLPAAAVHRRDVSLEPGRRLLTVVDRLDTPAEVPVRLSWHLGPDVRVDLNGTLARLSWPAGGERRSATLSLPGDLQWTAHRGERDPVLGWYSPGFGRRTPMTSLVGVGSGSRSSRLVTALAFG